MKRRLFLGGILAAAAAPAIVRASSLMPVASPIWTPWSRIDWASKPSVTAIGGFVLPPDFAFGQKLMERVDQHIIHGDPRLGGYPVGYLKATS